MSDVFHREGLIPRLTREETVAAAEAIGLPIYLCDLAIFQVLLRHRPLARAVNDFLSVLLLKGDLDDRLRELVIMRVGWVTGSAYEWAQHWRIAPQFGVPEDDLIGVRDWENHHGFGPVDRAVLAATDEALAGGPITTSTWAACERELGGPTELLELFTVIGAWSMISTLLRALEIPLEEEVGPWPPDGAGPEVSS